MASTFFTQTQFSPANRTSNYQTPAQGYANLQYTRNEVYDTINKMFTNPSMMNSENVAFENPIKDKEQDAFIYHLLSANSNLQDQYRNINVQKLLASATGARMIDQLKGQIDFGVGGIDYIDSMANDQVRKYGIIYKDGIRDNRIRFAVENYALDKYKIASGNVAALGIPMFNTTVNVAGTSTPVALEVSPFKAWSNYGTSCDSCLCSVKTSCANSRQRVYITKKRSFAPGAEQVTIIADIDSVKYNPDGSMTLMLIPAPSRANPLPTNLPGVNAWQNPGDIVEPGDVIEFGSHQPTNLCDMTSTGCYTSDMPEPTIYCTTTHTFSGCVFCAETNQSVSRMDMQFPAKMRFERDMMLRVRDMVHNWGTDILYSDNNYAAGNRRPIPIPNDSSSWRYSDCDIIPFAMLGLITAAKKYGKIIEHYFSSCYDVCGTAFLKRLMEILSENIQDSNPTLNIDSANFTLTGDIRGIRNFEKAQDRSMYNQYPFQFSRQDAMSLTNDMKSDIMPTNPNSTDLFGARWNGVKEVYDSNLAYKHTDTLFLLPELGTGARWFASNNRQMVKDTYGMDINTLDSVANNGQKVTPTIYSDSYNNRHNLTKDIMENVPTNGCSVKYNAYMKVGLFIHANKLMNTHIFKFGFEKTNTAYLPSAPYSTTNQPIVRVSLSEADCANSCSAIEKNLRNMFQTWNKEGLYS